MSEEPWKSWLYLDGDHLGDTIFVIPTPSPPGVPGRANTIAVPLDHPAVTYWIIRESWSALGPADFQAFYDKWSARRDTALDPDETYLGKAYDEWALFYAALADEMAHRQHVYTKLDHFGGTAVLQAMSDSRKAQAQLGGRSG